MINLGKSVEAPKQEGVAIVSRFPAEHIPLMGTERYELLSSGVLSHIPKDMHGRGVYVL